LVGFQRKEVFRMAVHWIVLLVAIVPFWLLQNIIHELAHGLTLRIGWGWRFRIWPLPSMKLGRFTFAHVVYEPTATSSTPDNAGWALVSIMPRLVNGVFIMLSSVSATLLWAPAPVASVLCALFAACNFVDFAVGMAGIFRSEPNQSDIWRYQTYMNANVGKMRWLAALTILGGLAMVAVPVLRFFGV
jgi:hypothetical protein